ncbi:MULTISPECIES: reverse transcriptase domain-containing protein [Clostridium]|uniref:RNA-directed DNA polymerase n=1 Tax=Clostridium frigoriphilum TaxID=443253 RepID=A0ABU7UX92_9CLOT|nr:reverse transcriptase domain-containing protein [Clostridium sp. DSM 17811]MBU3101702.1 trypsin-like peptidase domain-containing protein [Clostridium sp. DSM 17811]
MFKKTDQQIKDCFYKLKNRSDVSDLLEIEDKSLRYFLYVKRPENLYVTFTVLKKNGNKRIINAPQAELKSIQRKLAYILNLVYKIKPSTHGFVIGKNIVTNANNHCKRKAILNIDLKDFFTQIHFGRVLGMLVKGPYDISKDAAIVISQIACCNAVLPQGAPSSPIITNMICSPLDTRLTRLAKKNNSKYTRYADDITFSTFDKQFSSNMINSDILNLKLGKDLNKAIKDNGFVVNEDKIFLNTKNTRQEVTGLVVNKFTNIKREYLKNIRAILHNCEKDNVYNTAKTYVKKGYCKNGQIKANIDDKNYETQVVLWFKAVIKGKINFIKDIRGKNDFIYLKCAEKANIIFKDQIFNISKLKDFKDKIISNVLVLKGDNNGVQGSGFLLKDFGLVTSFHVTQDNAFYKAYHYNEYEETSLCVISKEINEIKSDLNIDYAIYKFNKDNENFLEAGSSVEVGDKVKIIGYPNFMKGNSYNVQTCYITSRKYYMGAIFFTVGGTVFHGASGGVVLNDQNKVVGIIKGGVVSNTESETNENQGFVPLDIVLTHFHQQ